MYQAKKKIEDVFLNILLKKDFQNVEITEIQKKARISSKKFYLLFRTKEEILFSFFQRIDDILEKKIKKNNFGNNLKDNLFEVCMTRLDILYPYKKNLQKLYTYLKKEPRIFLKLYESFFKSMFPDFYSPLFGETPLAGGADVGCGARAGRSAQ